MRNPHTLILTLMVGGGLMLFAATPASAHGPGYRYAATPACGRPHYPRWLHSHRGFHDWYRQSRYRQATHPGRHRLFDIYRNDRRYHRKLELRAKRGHRAHRRYRRHR